MAIIARSKLIKWGAFKQRVNKITFALFENLKLNQETLDPQPFQNEGVLEATQKLKKIEGGLLQILQESEDTKTPLNEPKKPKENFTTEGQNIINERIYSGLKYKLIT